VPLNNNVKPKNVETENLFKNYYQLIDTVDDCINKHMVLPALILIYSAIDSASWIASDNPNEGVGTRFKRWVDEWMLRNSAIKCNSEELYAARCGILHTLTPYSTLSNKKGVRRIAYAWGKANARELEETISVLSMDGEVVSVHLDDLFWVFRIGFADYLDYVFNNTQKRDKFLSKSGLHFANLEMEKMDEFLELTRKA
jgi:hypothetical protein